MTTKKRTATVAAVSVAAALTGGMVTAVPAVAAGEATVNPQSVIGQAWAQNKDLGAAMSTESCSAGGLRCEQRFRSGMITWNPSAGARVVRAGAILTEYLALGGSAGVMGASTGPKTNGLRDGASWQPFEQGGIFTHPTTGTHEVRSGFWWVWSVFSRENGVLGFPTTGEYVDERGMVEQDFQRGLTIWRPGHDSVPVIGAMAAAWKAGGGAGGPLGYPVGWEIVTRGGGSTWQPFERGALFWSKTTGAVPVHGGIWASYQARDADRGPLGLPTSPEKAVPGGAEQSFQGGRLYWSERTGQVVAVTTGDILTRWDQLGGPSSSLGLPVGEKTPLGDGFAQRFERGGIGWGPGIGAKIVDPVSYDVWITDPARYGWPTKDRATDSRGVRQAYEWTETITKNGRLYSAEQVGPSTAVLVCDSQCDLDSWGEQGARANGYSQIVERAYGGGGYAAVAGWLGSSVTDGLTSSRILLPEGNPGLVMLTLGGNDATQGKTDEDIVSGMRRTLDTIRATYPGTRIVINGVMSRNTDDHARRRAVDAVIGAEAARQGLPFVSVAGWGSTPGTVYADGVHLTQAGHNTLAPAYTDALRKALQ